MGKRYWLGLALCAFAATAIAGVAEVRKQIEMSMLVTGTIDIDPDGSVAAHSIDQPDKLPPAVLQLLDKALPHWRFEPVVVDGRIVRARSQMGVRVVARKLEDGNYQLRIGSVSFGQNEGKATEKRATGKQASKSGKRMGPPKYPPGAYRAGVTGTVYLLLKLDEQGDVADVTAEQVNLYVVGNERQMEQARKQLSDASIAAARRWRFDEPAHDVLGDDGYAVIRVPIDYRFRGQKDAGYGEWKAYVPGPRQRPSWADDEDDSPSPDAMIAGQAYPVGSGPRLLTPFTQG